MTTPTVDGFEDDGFEDEPEETPWEPREPKPFYWLKEVCGFLGISSTNLYHRMKRKDIKAKRVHDRGRDRWAVTHTEMVRYMAERSGRLPKSPIVEAPARHSAEATPTASLPDPVPQPKGRRKRVTLPGADGS